MGIFDVYKDIFGNLKVIGEAFSYVWFIVLPVALYYLFKMLFLDHTQTKFLTATKYDLLEIVPPRNVEKSPKPMESFYVGLSGVITTYNAVEEYIKGMLIHKFSLELTSDEGTVHFYIRTPREFRHLVEANLYAQYPDVIINEVSDYINDVPAVIPSTEWDLWGTDFELVAPDPYPIKTYKYFEEDVTGKMIDPLSGVVEAMGKLKPGQKIWFQYVIIPERESWNAAEKKKLIDELAGRAKKVSSAWSGISSDFTDVIGSLGKGLFGPVEFKKKEEKKDEQPLEFRLTPVEREILKAVESNFAKSMFKVKMRFVLLGKRENFDKSFISSFIGALKQFNDINLNSFKPNDPSKTRADYFMPRTRLRFRQRKLFKRYKDRDLTGATFYLSSEELATVFHLPDMSVVAPSVTFVEAKRGGAPANLPIE